MILKHRDRELLRFEWLEPQGVRVLSVNEAEKRFLPLEMHGEATDKTFTQKRVAEILEFGVKADRCVSISKKVCTVNPTNCESLALQIKANLKADPYITKAELAEILGVSARSIAYKIKQLKDAGAIGRCGSAKKGIGKCFNEREEYRFCA